MRDTPQTPMTDTPQSPADTEDEISLLDLLQVIVDNLRLLLLGPLTVGILALIISLFIPPTYTAKTQFLPPQQQQSSASALLQSLGAMGGLASAAGAIKNPADQFVGFLKSVSIQEKLVERFNLKERYKTNLKIETRKVLESNTKIIVGKDGIINLQVDDGDPQFAAKLANGYVEELRKLMGRMSLTEAQLRRAFFETKLNETKESLGKADQELRMTGINASTLKSSPAAAVEVVARLKANVVAQEIKISSMRGYLSDGAPELKQAILELNSIKNQLSNSERSESKEISEGSYIEKYRNYKYQETLYELFAKQYEMARIDEAREGAVIQVLDFAEIPEKKSKPNRILIMIASVIASLVMLISILMARFILIKKGWRELLRGGLRG